MTIWRPFVNPGDCRCITADVKLSIICSCLFLMDAKFAEFPNCTLLNITSIKLFYAIKISINSGRNQLQHRPSCPRLNSYCYWSVHYYAPPLIGGGIKRCFCLTSVSYIGPKSRTERHRKRCPTSHVTRTPLSGSKAQRSTLPGRFGWLFKSLHNVIDSLSATVQSKPLPVDHEYSWRKARWAPQE